MRGLACLIVLTGCWTSSSTSSPAPPQPMRPAQPAQPADAAAVATVVDAPPAVDAGQPIQGGLYPACPASFALAQGAGACNFTYGPCRYPEGVCACSAPPWCGGAAPPRDYGQHRSWQCTPDVRPDGCPGYAPNAGMPCTTPGKQCDYTCSCVVTATCTKGTWTMQRGPCKP